MRPIPITTKRNDWTYRKPDRSVSPYDYTYFLRRRRGEVNRLTPQLVYLVNDIAWDIADCTDAWTSKKVDGVGHLSVVYYYSFINKRKHLVAGKFKKFNPTVKCPGGAFGYGTPLGQEFFYDGDLNSPARTASREQYIKLANALEEVVLVFNANQEEIYYRLLDAFEHLRHLVGST